MSPVRRSRRYIDFVNGTAACGRHRSKDVRRSAWRKHIPELVLAGVPTILILLEIWFFDPGDEVATHARRRWLPGDRCSGSAGIRLRPSSRTDSRSTHSSRWDIRATSINGPTSSPYSPRPPGSKPAGRSSPWRSVGSASSSISCASRRRAGLILGGAVLAIWTAGWFAGRAQFARVRETEVIRERDHFEGGAGGSAGHSRTGCRTQSHRP